MNRDYSLIDRTPSEHQCLIGSCPAVYEPQIVDHTPDAFRCGIGACPGVLSHKTLQGSYIIVGKRLEQADVVGLGLEARVAKDETAVLVPKGIIDLFERST